MIDDGYRSVGRVHRADDVHVGRNAEWRFLASKRNRLVSVLEEIHQFAENAGQVPSIDLIDDQHARRTILRTWILRTWIVRTSRALTVGPAD